jgi:predicted anti-sigma-YlaC factor YlaD
MDHQDAQELFSDYLEGELPPEQQRELTAHLEGCEPCQREFSVFQQTLRSLSGLQILSPPEGFVGKVQQRIYRRSRGRFFITERMMLRIPFEWISFIIILLMLAMYLILILGQARPIGPDLGNGKGMAPSHTKARNK